MRTGKLPEHTFKRSVVNAIRYRNDEVSFRPAVGHDGAVFGDMVTAMATTAFYYAGHELYAYNNAINNCIAAGGAPFAVSLACYASGAQRGSTSKLLWTLLLKELRRMGLILSREIRSLFLRVRKPTVVVTAYGKRLFDNRHKEVKPGMDIVMTKWTGLYGGAILAKTRKDELVTRYPESYIDIAASYMKHTSLIPELNVIKRVYLMRRTSIYAAHDVSNGGVFGALWQLLSACNVGAQIPVKNIPMKQEIIEVCEYFNINPYMMNGQGSLLDDN